MWFLFNKYIIFSLKISLAIDKVNTSIYKLYKLLKRKYIGYKYKVKVDKMEFKINYIMKIKTSLISDAGNNMINK